MSNIDRIDQKIIFFLQQDGRLTNFELAEKVGLSPSPCLRRVKNLEKDDTDPIEWSPMLVARAPVTRAHIQDSPWFQSKRSNQ